MTQKELIMEYFLDNPNRDIPHVEVVDWATQTWQQRKGAVFRDPDRAIRSLYAEGKLIKVGKGLYKYDPDHERNMKSELFTPEQKKAILERDDYTCAVCGLGREEGLELQVDHIRPRERGGKAELSNGQVLCSVHNYRKKTYEQTESGKRMFINLLRLAKEKGDERMAEFCREVLVVYEVHDINGHIQWDDSSSV